MTFPTGCVISRTRIRERHCCLRQRPTTPAAISRKLLKFYRRAYFFAAGSDAAKEAETKLTSLGQDLTPLNAGEAQAKADKLFDAKNYAAADKAYSDLYQIFPPRRCPPSVIEGSLRS